MCINLCVFPLRVAEAGVAVEAAAGSAEAGTSRESDHGGPSPR